MKRPTKPKKPTEPVKPEKIIDITKNISMKNGQSVQSLLDLLPTGLDLNQALISFDADYREFYTYCSVKYKDKHEHSEEYYKKLIDSYQKKYDKYLVKMIDYETKMIDFETKHKAYLDFKLEKLEKDGKAEYEKLKKKYGNE